MKVTALFKDLKAEDQRVLRILDYQNSFADKMRNLYDIEIPGLINRDSADLLKFAYEEGMAGIVKYKDGYAIGRASYVGNNLSVDGLLDQVLVTFLNGEKVQVPAEQAAVLWMNHQHRPLTTMVARYSNLLSDIDCAMSYNVNFSKLCPIPVVETDTEKKGLETIIEQVYNGARAVFKRLNLRSLSNSQDNTIPMIDLTNPQASNYISNYSSVHDEIILRLCSEMGICLNTKDKKAQVNNGELSGFSDYACLCGKSLQTQIDIFIKQCKDNLGIDVTITPSEFVYTEQDIRDEFDAVNNMDSAPEETESGEEAPDDNQQND